jgi:hypothetical protein
VDSKKLAALLILPMLMFVVVPVVAVTHATSSNIYELRVECTVGDSDNAASAKISFLGHTVSVTCTPDDYSENGMEFQSQLSGLFTASATAGPLTQKSIGFFNPHSCYADGVLFDPAISSWAYWEVYSSGCD